MDFFPFQMFHFHNIEALLALVFWVFLILKPLEWREVRLDKQLS